MKSFQKIKVFLFALAIVFKYVASATPISGKVADAGTGEAIIGATIYDSRSHVGVITDAEGNFRIDVATFPSELKGSYGNKLYNALQRRLELTGDSYNVLTTVKDAWTPTNPSHSLPLASNARPFGYIDSRYVQNASYLKLRNLTVGYTVQSSKFIVHSLRVYATASNLLTITPYKGYDPEVSSGTDSGAYPASRTFTFGVNVML